MTTCKDDQFTCDDGICIDMSSRCDRKEDCLVCKIFTLDYINYWKRLFAGRLPANSELFAGRLPANSELSAGSLPANSELFAGRLPVNNELFAGRPPANDK